MIAINSAVEIDLTGQVAADSIGARIYSGIGGQMDFMHGAKLSQGGKAIIALPSTAKGGAASRIVPTIASGGGRGDHPRARSVRRDRIWRRQSRRAVVAKARRALDFNRPSRCPRGSCRRRQEPPFFDSRRARDLVRGGTQQRALNAAMPEISREMPYAAPAASPPISVVCQAPRIGLSPVNRAFTAPKTARATTERIADACIASALPGVLDFRFPESARLERLPQVPPIVAPFRGTSVTQPGASARGDGMRIAPCGNRSTALWSALRSASSGPGRM